jgi:hypothetical protein
MRVYKTRPPRPYRPKATDHLAAFTSVAAADAEEITGNG